MAKAKKLLGKDADLFRDDETPGEAARTVDKMSPEQVYQRSLEAGLPRDRKVEATLNMAAVQLP